MTDDALLDEAYTRLSGTGPEFEGWLSNHGPMAADALLRLGHGTHLHAWIDAYLPRLQDAPRPRWPIAPEEWRDPLGDPSRLGDWRALLARELREDPWQAVLSRWWPRLLPGAAASAAHGLIRTGHVVRALRERESEARRDELGEALAYWAARWQPLPRSSPSRGARDPEQALDGLPAVGTDGGFRTRVALLHDDARWPAAVGAVGAVAAAAVPAALDRLVDAAVGRYAAWGHASPVMLVHAATAPRAASLVLASLPPALWPATHEAAWRVTAAVVSAYRPAAPAPVQRPHADVDDVVARAVRLGDAHAVKFVETALEAHQRGGPDALTSADRAVDLIALDG